MNSRLFPVNVGVSTDQIREWCAVAARAAADKKGEDIVILAVGNIFPVTDAFVITSGANARQVRTIAEEVEDQVKAAGGPAPLHIEGLDDARWVLLDYGDFVVHVFLEEVRRFYDLERLWADARALVLGPTGCVGGCRGVSRPPAVSDSGRRAAVRSSFVDLGGFEPPTFTMPWCCATELRYRPVSEIQTLAGPARTKASASSVPCRCMAEPYDPQAIEKKWQDRWAADRTYEVDNDDPRPPVYVLCMYPYPSGPAHQGHVRNYTFGDLIVRQRTMSGHAVLSPIGFDSFGLPAENAALKTGTHPRVFTDRAHRRAEGQPDPARRGLRLAPRGAQPRPRVHQVEPGHLRAVPGGGPGLPQAGPGQLVPGLPDRAGQRAGAGRRHLRAQRRRGRQAGSRAVVLPHHRLRRRPAGRPGRPGVAGAGQDHAAQLDRALRGGRVRPARRRGRRASRSGCSPPARTPASA